MSSNAEILLAELRRSGIIEPQQITQLAKLSTQIANQNNQKPNVQPLIGQTYDTSTLGKIRWIPLIKRTGDSGTNALTEQAVATWATNTSATNAGINQVGATQQSGAVIADIIEEWHELGTMLTTATDAYMMEYDANTANFVESFYYIPDQTQFVYKWLLQIPFILFVSAYTSGNFKLGTIRAVITDVLTGNTILDTRPLASGFSNMANTGAQVTFLRFVNTTPYKLVANNPIKIQISITNSAIGVGTYYAGYMPMAPDISLNNLKFIYRAALGIQAYGTPDHPYTILSDPKYVTTYDYGGIAK